MSHKSYIKRSRFTANKFGSIRQTYNGHSYDSRLEAQYAANLDWMIKAGEVKKWERQFKISIDLKGVHITNYFIDFKVWFTDGKIEYHEVKGPVTEVWDDLENVFEFTESYRQSQLKSKMPSEEDIKNLKFIRNYFGEHDKHHMSISYLR